MLRHCVLVSSLLYLLVACGQDKPEPKHDALTPIDGGDDVVDLATIPAWSDPETWGGSIPSSGADVTIDADKSVRLDRDAVVGNLTVEGTLVLDEVDLELSADSILVHGRVQIGALTAPFEHRARIVLTGDPDDDHNGMGGRVIGVMPGGTFSIHAKETSTPWTQLGAHADAGTDALQLADAVDWKNGDRIVVAPTDFYDASHTEQRTLAADSDGATLTLDRPLDARHWGELQTFGSMELDERAEVANLSRLVTIEGADDSRFANDGQGAHIMVMSGAALRLSGVELHRVGQLGRLARYPIHWHRMSYDESGNEVSNVEQYVKSSVVWESRNRCITIHATNDVTVSGNICYDILGHAVFLEDGVERRNTIENNLVLYVRNPPEASALLLHDLDSPGGSSSGYWITNPDNIVRGNAAADAQGNGFWLAFPNAPHGPSSQVAIQPNRLPLGVFEDNRTHSNGEWGLQFDFVQIDDAGDTTAELYQPFVGGDESGERVPVTISHLTTFKHPNGGLWNRVMRLTFDSCVAADNANTAFQGASQQGHIQNSLIVGVSANDATPMPADQPPVGVASYHSEFDITGNTIANFALVPGFQSGAFNTGDYYIRPVEKGLVRNKDNVLIATDPAWRMAAPPEDLNHTFSGALWDPNGLVGPAGNYWVFDVPFLTEGTECTPVAPAGQNGTSCVGPYYGIQSFVYDEDASTAYTDSTEMEYLSSTGARWFVRDGTEGEFLPNMRHAALVRGGTFTVTFPKRTSPRTIEYRVDNVYSTDDWVVLGVEFDGTVDPTGYVTTWQNSLDVRNWAPGDPRLATHVRRLSPAASLDETLASSGEKFFQDKTQNLVYVKIQGGLEEADLDPTTQDALYNPMRVHLYPQ